MLPVRYTWVNNKCLYIMYSGSRTYILYDGNIIHMVYDDPLQTSGVDYMMGILYIWYMMIHCRQVNEVHVWCLVDYGVMW